MPSFFFRLQRLTAAPDRCFTHLWLLVGITVVLFAGGCGDSDASQQASSEGSSGSERIVVATVPSLGMIMTELTAGRASVNVLLAPGASPHTYEPTPSDVRAISNSLMLVHAHDHLDGWVASLPAERTLELAPFIPSGERIMMPSAERGGAHSEHAQSDVDRLDGDENSSGQSNGETMSEDDPAHDGDLDPHFWTSPPVVQAIVPPLVDSLCAADADGCETYRANGDAFITDLEVLHRRIASMLRPVEGMTVALSQPFFQYFLHEYGLPIAAVIEPHPGKEPSPQRIRELIDTVREGGASVIFTQTQLPGRSARVISDEAGIPTHDLDPLGGEDGRVTYTDFMMYNAQEILTALRAASEPASASPR